MQLAITLAAVLALFLAVIPAPPLAAQDAAGGAPDLDDAVRAWTDAAAPELLELYKSLHAHPELSFQEVETAKLVAARLRALGFEVTPGVGGHGLVGVLKNGPGPTVMVRTDLDALPIVESTGLEFASKVKVRQADGSEVGAMHACGHDVHMAVFAGTAAMLARLKDQWQGTLVFLGQPAEERGSGAHAMLADGLFERFPRPDRCLALHCHASLAAGKVGTCEGFALANVDSVDILVRGQGGHGAYPHTTKDPIVLAAQIVLALQTIHSREVPPLDPSVVTVGSIHGGTKHNIIPDEVKLELTVRSYKDSVREQILAAIKRIADGCGRAAGVPDDRLPVVTVLRESIPSTYNDPGLTRRVHAALGRALGAERVIAADPVMGGEDFGCYGRVDPKIPICMFWLGAVEPAKVERALREKKPLPSLHSAEFAPDADAAIRTGVRAMTAAALESLKATAAGR
jgi:amidohydrolase